MQLNSFGYSKAWKVYNTICGNKITQRRVADDVFVKVAYFTQKCRRSYVVTLLYDGAHRISLYLHNTLPHPSKVR